MGMSIEEKYSEELRQELERQAEDLAMGSADDYPEYRERVGYVKGIMFAADAFKSIANRARKEPLDD